MAELGFEMLLRFLWGSALLLTLVSRRETSERFPRIAAWIILPVAACGVWLAHGSEKIPFPMAAGTLAALTLGFFLYAFGVARTVRILGFLLVFASPVAFLRGQTPGQWFNFAGSAFLLGAVFAGQYTGHWFLTVPGMHIRELIKLSYALIAALAVRSLQVAWTLFFTVGLHPAQGIDAMGRPVGVDVSTSATVPDLSQAHSLFAFGGDAWFGLGFYGSLLLLARVLWGLVAPWLLSYMVLKTVSSRSTQSATGILYALCVMMLLGEGTALYLQITLGWNL